MFIFLVLAILTNVVLLAAVWIVDRVSHFKQLKLLGLRGPTPEFVFGNYGQLKYTPGKTPIDVMSDWERKYGKVYGYYEGLTPRIVISDLDILKDIMIKEFSNFTNRGLPSVSGDILHQNDQRWKELRQILAPTFSSKKLKMVFPTMQKCMNTFTTLVSEQKGKEFNISSLLQAMTLDAMTKIALAMDIDCQRNPNHPTFVALRNFLGTDMGYIYAFYFSFPGPMRLLFKFLRQVLHLKIGISVLDDVKKYVERVVEMRKLSPEKKHPDILQLLMDAARGFHEEEEKVDKEDKQNIHAKPSKQLLTDEEVVSNAMVFLEAGYETTSNALGFTFYCLTKHPEIQERAYQEAREALGDKDQLDYEDIPKLQYIEQVLSEALRLYPSIPLFVYRETRETINIKGVTIPKGSLPMAPVYNIHHDPNVWEEPDKFDPERFSPENKSKQHSMAYMPFGAGPRICIGKRFALIESKLCIAQTLLKFKLVRGPTFQDPLRTVICLVQLNAANGIWIKAEPRQTHT